MPNMNTIQKVKGKKQTSMAKNKPSAVMDCSDTSSNQRIGSKKRKHEEMGEGNSTAPLPKKSKRKRNNEKMMNEDKNDKVEIISQEASKLKNIKKKKSEVAKLEKVDAKINVENEENNEQQINAKPNITNKTKKKAKMGNEMLLHTNIPLEVKDELISSDQVIPLTIPDTDKDNSVTKKHKKKMKQSEIDASVAQNGDDSSNLELLNDSRNFTNLDGSSLVNNTNVNDVLTNSFNNLPQKFLMDIEENPVMDIKTDVSQISYNNLNNNEKEIKREVNVIDIKSEGGKENTENVVTISIRDIGGANTNEDEDELLKQLERKLKPKVPKETINWPEADLKELFNRMEKCIPPNDTKPYTKRLEEMEWDNIIFKGYTVEECRNVWFKLQKKFRRYRVLNEILQDAKQWVKSYSQTNIVIARKKGRPQKHPDMPRKPLTAYFIFYLENRDSYLAKHPGVDASEVSKALALIFQSLSTEEKKKYDEIALQKKKEYLKSLEEFYKTHPEVPRATKESKRKPEKPVKASKLVKGKPPPKPPKQKAPIKPHPPFHYFYTSELEKENVGDKVKFKEICKERWKHLPERNKLVWIHYAEAESAKYEEEMEEYIKNHPHHVKNPFKPILSKEDIQIKDRAAGKPTKPPGSAYNLFASKLLQSDEIKKVPVRDRLIFVSNQWKYCSEDEKKDYKEMYNEMIKKYKQEFTAYLKTLPEDERKEELKKTPPKMIKTERKKKSLQKEPQNKRDVTSSTKKSMPKSKSEQIHAQQPEKLKEPQQPPISPFKYFCSIYSGDEPVGQAWKGLGKEQRKVYEEKLIQKKKEYIRDFETFLKSLTEEELEAFSKSRRRAKEEQQDNEDEESDSYDSEETSDEEEQDEK